MLIALLWLRCHNVSTGEIVAIKQLPGQIPAGALPSNLSILEAEVLQEATRQGVPGVVRFRELVYGTDGYQYLVQE